MKDNIFDLQLFAEGEPEANAEKPEEQAVQPNITVHENGSGGLTAEVETVDPMADPEESEEKPAEKPEAKAEDDATNNIEEDLKKQEETQKDLKADLATKGVDFDAVAAEFDKNGSLSAESLEALNKAGYPKSVVDAYINGLQATQERFVSTVQSYAGGADNYKQLISFVQTQPKEVVEAYNASIQSGNLGQIKLAIIGLQSQMTKTYGTSNPSILGNGSAKEAPNGYTSMEQMTKDMSDPRYQKDPKFTREVMQKIKNATIF